MENGDLQNAFVLKDVTNNQSRNSNENLLDCIPKITIYIVSVATVAVEFDHVLYVIVVVENKTRLMVSFLVVTLFNSKICCIYFI